MGQAKLNVKSINKASGRIAHLLRAGLSAALSAALAFALVPASAFAAAGENKVSLLSSDSVISATGVGQTDDIDYAFRNVYDYGTVTLLKDCSTDYINVKTNCDLDLAGHTLTCRTGWFLDYAIYVMNGKSFTIRDSVGGGKIESLVGGIQLEDSDSKLTIEGDVTIAVADKSAGVYLNASKTEFTMNGGTIIGKSSSNPITGVWINDDDCTFTMNDGAILNNYYSTDYNGVYVKGRKNPTITVNGGTISSDYGDAIYAKGNTKGTITVAGGTISVPKASTSKDYAAIYLNDNDSLEVNISSGTLSGPLALCDKKSTSSNISITGGTFKGKRQDIMSSSVKKWNCSITGGNFTDNTKQTIDSHYQYESDGNNRYNVVPRSYVVTLNANGGSFIDGVTTTQTLEYKKTATPTYKVVNGNQAVKGWSTSNSGGSLYDFSKPVDSDMTLYAQWTTSPECELSGSGLTVNGNKASVKYASFRDALDDVADSCTMTLLSEVDLGESMVDLSGKKNLTLNLNGQKIAMNQFVIYAFRLLNGTSLTVEDTPGAGNGGISAAYGGCFQVDDSSSLTVKSGTIQGDLAGIVANSDRPQAKVTIEGGAVKGNSRGIWLLAPCELKVSGGAIFGNRYAIESWNSQSTAVISGGEFACAEGSYGAIGCTNATVSGGVFSSEVGFDQCAEGHVPTANTDEITRKSHPWTVVKGHKVTFDACGGTFTGSTTVGVAEGHKVTQPADPTYDSHTFKGWYTAAEGGEVWNFETGNPTEDMTLYAQWQDDTPVATHTITFDANGGSYASGIPLTKEITSGQKASIPEQAELPMREGYALTGWSLDAAGEQPFDFENTAIDNSFTLYAQWEKEVVYVAQVGDNKYDSLQAAFDAAAQDGTVKLIADVELEDTVFPAGKVTLDLNGHKVSSVKTLDENENEQDVATFLFTVTDASLKVTDTSAAKDGSISAQGLCVALMDATGFELEAGTLSSAFFGGLAAYNSSTATTDINISGGVIKNTYLNGIALSGSKIYFSMTGGSVSGECYAIQEMGDSDIKLSITGGTLTGYSGDDPRYTEQYSSDVSASSASGFVSGGTFSKAVPIAQCATGYIPAENVGETTTYGVQAGFTVGFDANGGTLGDGSGMQCVKAGEKAVKPSDPTREGYIFAGWYTAAEGGTAFDFDAEPALNVTLYAHWATSENKVAKPEFAKVADTPTYNGEEQTGVSVPVENDAYAVTGLSGTDAGTYTARASLEDGFIWEDGSYDDVMFEWSIAKKAAKLTINDATMTAGDDEPDYTGTFESVIEGDSLNVKPTLENGADTTKPGSYKITATYSNDNYDLAITPGTLTVKAKAMPAKKAVAKTFTVNVKTVTAKAVKAAAKKVGATAKTATSITLGKKVKTIKASAFKSFKKVKTITVKTKKLTKKSVKKALKGSKVKTIKVKIGSKKVNKKYVKKYKKIFTKKVAGKKAKVK